MEDNESSPCIAACVYEYVYEYVCISVCVYVQWASSTYEYYWLKTLLYRIALTGNVFNSFKKLLDRSMHVVHVPILMNETC